MVFLNFWASWCPPCQAEAGLLEQAWQRYKDRGVVFLGVDRETIAAKRDDASRGLTGTEGKSRDTHSVSIR